MEPDRYQQSSKLFIFGMVCLLLSLTLFTFGFYLFPNLIFGWIYSIPGFVLVWQEWFKQEYSFTDSGAAWAIISLLIVPATICGYISYWISNRIDNQIYEIKPEVEQTEGSTQRIGEQLQESLGFGFKIFLLLVLVLIAVFFVEWLLSVPAPIEE